MDFGAFIFHTAAAFVGALFAILITNAGVF